MVLPLHDGSSLLHKRLEVGCDALRAFPVGAMSNPLINPELGASDRNDETVLITSATARPRAAQRLAVGNGGKYTFVKNGTTGMLRFSIKYSNGVAKV
jgi:hypothetical protein